MSDDRFARQDRFELPSEFLLTSPCTSIVHHLSGRTTMAITAKNDYIIYLRFSCANDNKIKRSEIKIIFITPLILTISMTCHSNTLLGPCSKTGHTAYQDYIGISIYNNIIIINKLYLTHVSYIILIKYYIINKLII